MMKYTRFIQKMQGAEKTFSKIPLIFSVFHEGRRSSFRAGSGHPGSYSYTFSKDLSLL
jgi:hypothetical protein